jgi:hypothetical protein
MNIAVDDISGPQIARFLDEHVQQMRSITPLSSKHALDLDGLRKPDITCWSIMNGDTLVSCGAIKSHDAGHAAVKSMRTAPPRHRSRIASLLLRHTLAAVGDSLAFAGCFDVPRQPDERERRILAALDTTASARRRWASGVWARCRRLRTPAGYADLFVRPVRYGDRNVPDAATYWAGSRRPPTSSTICRTPGTRQRRRRPGKARRPASLPCSVAAGDCRADV